MTTDRHCFIRDLNGAKCLTITFSEFLVFLNRLRLSKLSGTCFLIFDTCFFIVALDVYSGAPFTEVTCFLGSHLAIFSKTELMRSVWYHDEVFYSQKYKT